MPDGLKYLFAAPGRQKSVIVLADELPSLYLDDFLQEILNNFSCQDNQHKYKIHLILYAISKTSLTINTTNTSVYEYAKSPSTSIGEIFKQLIDQVEQQADNNILVVDDFSLLSLLSSNRHCSKMRNFLRKCCTKFQRVFIFSNRETLSSGEISVLYEIASAVTILGSSVANSNVYICDLLKIKAERKISHVQTKYQVINGEIIEFNEDFNTQSISSRNNQEEVLKTLTTFKLTVEDSEKESRSKLYLPYFDAQKVTIENPDDFDEYDDEDDEV